MIPRVFLNRALRIGVAAMLLAALVSGTAIAKSPSLNLNGTATPVPGTVSAGSLVRFNYSVTNTSNSNFSTFFVDAVTPNKDFGAQIIAIVDGPSVTPATTTTPTCDTSSGDLHCRFGPLNSGSVAKVDVVYRTPSNASGSWTVPFAASSNGAPGTDPGNSHGDAYTVNGRVTIGTGNDGGGYIFGDDTIVQNNQNLSKKNNPQSAKLDFSNSTEDNFGATVSEAATTACPTGITTCYGSLVIMNAKSGLPIAGGFLATVGYFSVPGSATGAFIHWLHDTATGDVEDVDYEIIDQSCADVTAGTPCISDTFKTGGNTFYVIQLYENGPMRGI